MKKKEITLDLPEYLGVKTYQDIVNFKGTGEAEKLINAIASIIEKDIEEVKQWPIKVLKELSDDISELAFAKEQFHTIVEFHGEL